MEFNFFSIVIIFFVPVFKSLYEITKRKYVLTTIPVLKLYALGKATQDD